RAACPLCDATRSAEEKRPLASRRDRLDTARRDEENLLDGIVGVGLRNSESSHEAPEELEVCRRDRIEPAPVRSRCNGSRRLQGQGSIHVPRMPASARSDHGKMNRRPALASPPTGGTSKKTRSGSSKTNASRQRGTSASPCASSAIGPLRAQRKR